jgi:hemoglobin/transferrin/lactoferrin receptor protein
MRKAFVLGLSLCMSVSVNAQQDTASPQKNLDEVIIYSNKFAERKKNIVQKIDVIQAQQIAQLNTQNMGDLLSNTGNVFVQKSQQGGSSPIIRGFEASRVLLVVDGIRMNNAIYRAGHLQNVITVDQNMLERVEVLYGPASTLYGSDALGGVVHMRTKMPRLSTNGKPAVSGSGFARFSSANLEKTIHADASIGGRKWAWLQSYNFSDFDDMRMGKNYSDKYPNYGRRSQYITSINGIDSVVHNENDHIQKFSGYKQWDLTQKLLFQPSNDVSHLLNLQLSNSSDVPRYDRLQDRRNGQLRFAEWYYGPQERQLAAYELNINNKTWFNNIKSLISYQHIEESRHQREYRRYDRKDNRLESLDVWNLTLDARKLWQSHEVSLGLDAQLNDVTSRAFRENILTGARTSLDSRYPNGSNKMNYYGIYAQHLFKIPGGRWVINDGIRFQAVDLRSTIADNSAFKLPFTEIRQENTAVTGNIGAIYMPNEKHRITFGLSSGFRAPNIDDAARIFESSNQQLVVPNENIKPEYTYNVDISLSKTFGPLLHVEINGFHTWFRNAIALSPFSFNGSDTVLYNNARVQVLANQNVNKAVLYGGQISLRSVWSDRLSAIFTSSYTRGRYIADPNALSTVFVKRANGNYVDSSIKVSSKPLDHIPPLFGRLSINYAYQKLQVESYVLFNGWKRIRDMYASGEDNPQYAAPNGFVSRSVIPDGYPAWFTANLKASYAISKTFTLQAGIENILDRNYRQFASGFSGAGRNFIFAIRSHF